jgi:hypothetical protein
MKTRTHSFVTHRTELYSEDKRKDGGRALLAEAFDFIHQEKQVGKLTAQFGAGGAISSLIFEETGNILQSDLEVKSE